MKIRMKTLMCGPDGNFFPDKEYNIPEKEAKSLLAGGFAMKVKQQMKTKIETATIEAPENAMLKKPKKGKKRKVNRTDEPQTDNSSGAGTGDARRGEEPPEDHRR